MKKIFIESLKLENGIAQDLTNILSISGDLELVRKKIEKDFKKFNILEEIEKIILVFPNEIIQEYKEHITVKFDMSFTPYEMLCYSGIYFEAFSMDYQNNPICFGGR